MTKKLLFIGRDEYQKQNPATIIIATFVANMIVSFRKKWQKMHVSQRNVRKENKFAFEIYLCYNGKISMLLSIPQIAGKEI